MKRSLTIIAALAALLLAAVLGLVMWKRGEAAAQWPAIEDEPALTISEPPLPPDDRAWALLEEAIERYDKENDGAQEQLEAIGLPVNTALWAHQQVSLARLKQALEQPGLRTPYREHIDDDIPDLIPLMHIARNQVLRGWESAESGLLIEAVDEMLLADALGSRLVDGSEDLIMVMIGLAISEIAQKELDELLTLLIRDDVALQARALAGLQANRPRSTAATARGVARDCLLFEVMCRDLGEHPERLMDEVSMDGEVTPRPIRSRLAALRYDADATIAQHRRICRATVRRMESPPYDRSDAYEPPLQASRAYNDIGNTLLKIASPDFTHLADEERRADVIRSGMVVVIAARLYALEHGELPTTLPALVPRLLDAVPLDPFTGKPLALEGRTLPTAAAVGDDPAPSWILHP